jgi:hypothetical protein
MQALPGANTRGFLMTEGAATRSEALRENQKHPMRCNRRSDLPFFRRDGSRESEIGCQSSFCGARRSGVPLGAAYYGPGHKRRERLLIGRRG